MIYQITAFCLTSIAGFFLILCAVAFFRAKDVFGMIKIALMGNFYIIPLLLLVICLNNFSLVSCFKIVILILLNCLISTLLGHLIIKRAINDGLVPDEEE